MAFIHLNILIYNFTTWTKESRFLVSLFLDTKNIYLVVGIILLPKQQTVEKRE